MFSTTSFFSKIFQSLKIFPNILSNYSCALVATRLDSEFVLLRMPSNHRVINFYFT